jgi:hypothetical protein
VMRTGAIRANAAASIREYNIPSPQGDRCLAKGASPGLKYEG